MLFINCKPRFSRVYAVLTCSQTIGLLLLAVLSLVQTDLLHQAVRRGHFSQPHAPGSSCLMETSCSLHLLSPSSSGLSQDPLTWFLNWVGPEKSLSGPSHRVQPFIHLSLTRGARSAQQRPLCEGVCARLHNKGPYLWGCVCLFTQGRVCPAYTTKATVCEGECVHLHNKGRLLWGCVWALSTQQRSLFVRVCGPCLDGYQIFRF